MSGMAALGSIAAGILPACAICDRLAPGTAAIGCAGCGAGAGCGTAVGAVACAGAGAGAGCPAAGCCCAIIARMAS